MGSKKGGGYEREKCKSLSIWWSHGTRDDIFWRTPGSGSRATMRKKKDLLTADAYGDVMSQHESGKPLTKKIVISLKRGYTGKKVKKNLHWASVLDIIDTPRKFKTKPAIITWWKELMRDVKAGKRKRGLLIFRRDRKRSVIAMSHKTFRFINRRKPHIFPYFGQTCHLQAKGLNIYLMRLDDFFYWCNPEILGAKRALIRRDQKKLPGYIKPGAHFNPDNPQKNWNELEDKIKKRKLRRRR